MPGQPLELTEEEEKITVQQFKVMGLRGFPIPQNLTLMVQGELVPEMHQLKYLIFISLTIYGVC
jgi:hypothetical protein